MGEEVNPPAGPQPEPLPRQSRVTVRDDVYFQSAGGEVVQYPGRVTRHLLTDEQPYGPRKIKVGPGWKALDCGWLPRASLLTLRHDGGGAVEVGVMTGDGVGMWGGDYAACWLLRPGAEALRGRPIDPTRVALRCPAGEAAVTLLLIPE